MGRWAGSLEDMEIEALNRNLFGDVYKGKKVLLTGHTGFKGSWLSIWLSMLGADVYGYSLEAPSHPSMFEELHLERTLKAHKTADICGMEALSQYFLAVQPDMVFHLAAQPLVRLSYRLPLETLSTNIMGTANVLECIRLADCTKAAVIVTTDKCYENNEWAYAYRENDRLGGKDIYSASKAAAELVINAYRSSFDKDNARGIASVRAGNVIGGGDWGENRLVPDCMVALSSGQPIAIRNPSSIRPWQFVLEPLAGYLQLGALLFKDSSRYTEAWNFGPSNLEKITVLQLAESIVNAWGSGQIQLEEAGQKLAEAGTLILDSSKASRLLGWSPVYNCQRSISSAVAWYQAYYNGQNEMLEFTTRQIEDYVSSAADMSVPWVVSS